MPPASIHAAVEAIINQRTQLGCAALDNHQLAAVLWLHESHGMAIDVPNVMNMLDSWTEIRRVGLNLGSLRAAGKPAPAVIVAGPAIGRGAFNPMHLVEFFASGPGM